MSRIRRFTHLRTAHWSEADAREVLAALDASGESVSTFAEHHGLHPHRLWRWRRKLSQAAQARAKGEDGPLEQVAFAPVVVSGLGREVAVVVRVGSVEIEIVDTSGVEASWLAALVRAAAEAQR